jgi:DNA-binding Xre family transcriptional regulator
MSKTRKPSRRKGSRLDDFLREEGLYDEVVAQAEKEILALKIQSAMKERRMSVSMLAKKMQTSRAAVKRILDPANPSITLGTLERTAFALGKRWKFQLIDS